MIKIKIHSFVDLITNSSTVIYTQATNYTIKCVKEMLEYILNLSPEYRHLKADDVFGFGIFMNVDKYLPNDNEFSREEENKYLDYIDNLIDDILSGKQKKPDWMTDCEDKVRDNGTYTDFNLYIHVKDKYASDKQFKSLKDMLLSLINCQEHYAEF